jgi:hypothetical protein
VNDVFRVHELDAFKNFAGKQRRALLRKSEIFSHQIVELAVNA